MARHMSRSGGVNSNSNSTSYALCAGGIFAIVLFLMYFKNKKKNKEEEDNIKIGPKGGIYYINSNGNKTYFSKEQKDVMIEEEGVKII